MTVVPGISSPLAVPAVAGIPVTHRGVTHDFTVVSGHLPPGHPDSLVAWGALARLRGTLVLLMAVENAPRIAAALLRGGREARTPVAVVCDGSMPTERTVLTTLGDLAPTWPSTGCGRRRSSSSATWSGGPPGALGPPPEPLRNQLSVAALVEVDDPRDPRLADYRDLRDVQLRQSLEAEHGLFIAEGEKVVRRAVEAGYPARSFLMARAGSTGWPTSSTAPTRRATSWRRRSPSRSPASTCTGVRWLARPDVRCPPSTRCSPARAPSWCSRTSSTTPTWEPIFRSAAALGVDAVLLSPRCADPLYRRSVKVAMGAVFSLPWTRLADWYDALPASSAAGSPPSR